MLARREGGQRDRDRVSRSLHKTGEIFEQEIVLSTVVFRHDIGRLNKVGVFLVAKGGGWTHQPEQAGIACLSENPHHPAAVSRKLGLRFLLRFAGPAS